MKVVGKAIPHESARAHVTGAACYTDDLAGRFRDVLTAWPVQAPHAHARVESLDTTAALAVPGVVAVLTAADVPGENDTGAARKDEPLFPEEVQYHGQPVAWVLAENADTARTAAERVDVRYAPLPAILTLAEAIRDASFLTEPLAIRRGDAAAALSRAIRVLDGTVEMGAQEHFYLETQASIAHADEDGHIFVHTSTQHPSETQEIVARVLGLKKHAVTCQSIRMGGAFGGKEVQANAWAAVAALGVRVTGRPVRVRLDRAQDVSMTGKRHPFLGRYRVGFDDDGRLLAVDLELFADGGWSLDLSEPILQRALFHCDNAYLIPDLAVVGRVCRTHKTSSTAFRGFGGPQGMVVIEEILDRVARALGLPPHVVRERNLYREGDETHYGQPVKDAGRIRRIWSDLQAESRFLERWREIEQFNAASPHVKRGLAITPVKFGISFTTAFFNQAGALVLVYVDGTVQVNHGGTEMGQGLHTKMQQIAVQALGVPLESVRIMPTRTDKVPNTSATAASSGSDMNGAAVHNACEQIRGRLAAVAGSMLHVEASDAVFEDGRVFPRDEPDRALAFADVARKAYLDRVQLFESGYYRTPDIHYDAKAGRGKPFHYFAFGAAVSEVEVDGFTGRSRVLRVDILHDVGDSISPLVDVGQIEGGFIQGLGWLTCEEVVWDAEGRVVTRGASTYKLPGLGECPPELHVRLLPMAAEPDVVHGSKAVGEPPFMLAISAREALRQAISAFGILDRVELAVPATPEAIYWSVERARTGSDAGVSRAYSSKHSSARS